VRASTLFAATLAILTGLGVVAAAKYSGFFAPREKETPPKPQPIMILAAKKNLFEGIALTADDVQVRALRADEMDAYQANKAKYLPPLTAAATLRILAKSVEADAPMLRDYLADQNIPDPLDMRLDPGTRAVNVAVPRDRAAGGLIQVGERVDVLLTAAITPGAEPSTSTTETACIARDLKVIVKRNTLWTVLAPVADERPINFTLQANPYRAALIDFARTKGDLTLVPTPSPKQLRSESRDKSGTPTFSDPDSKEYKDEDVRIAALTNGELTVGDQDLERIFNLKPPPPKVPPVTVERYSGLQFQGTTVFTASGRADIPAGKAGASSMGPPPPDKASAGYQFSAPAESPAAKPAESPAAKPADNKDCPTCGKPKKP
jgi:Flp pilus assembly protein CpaB